MSLQEKKNTKQKKCSPTHDGDNAQINIKKKKAQMYIKIKIYIYIQRYKILLKKNCLQTMKKKCNLTQP